MIAGFIALVVMALVLDGIEWMIDNWWIILIVVVLWIAIRALRRLGVRNGWFGGRGVSFRRLIKAAASDGVITEKERAAIIRKGVERGMDAAEAEIMMEAKLNKMGVTSKKSTPSPRRVKRTNKNN